MCSRPATARTRASCRPSRTRRASAARDGPAGCRSRRRCGWWCRPRRPARRPARVERRVALRQRRQRVSAASFPNGQVAITTGSGMAGGGWGWGWRVDTETNYPQSAIKNQRSPISNSIPNLRSPNAKSGVPRKHTALRLKTEMKARRLPHRANPPTAPAVETPGRLLKRGRVRIRSGRAGSTALRSSAVGAAAEAPGDRSARRAEPRSRAESYRGRYPRP